jgi:hypothetical protein
MGRTRLHTLAYWVLWIIKWVAAVLAGLLAFTFQAVPEWVPDVAESIILEVRDYARWIFLVCAILLASTNKITTYLKPPETWGAIHSFLDNLRDYFFQGSQDPVHSHRVTLFKWKKWTWSWRELSIRRKRWPWSSWLVPVARSGHTMQCSSTRFLAPRDKPQFTESFAGQVWTRNETRVLNKLPDLHSSPSEGDFESYARATSVSVDRLKRRLNEDKPCARAFCGMPVEVNNKLWGVIVIDTQIEELPDSLERKRHKGCWEAC